MVEIVLPGCPMVWELVGGMDTMTGTVFFREQRPPGDPLSRQVGARGLGIE